MKKLLMIIAIFGFATVFFTACDNETTKDVSEITNFATFDMTGDALIFHPAGTDFIEPGIGAKEAGVPVDVATYVDGSFSGYSGSTVDGHTPEFYNITYEAINSDGYPGYEYRDVYVYDNGDLVNSIAGIYTSDIVRNGISDPAYMGLAYIMIWQIDATTYGISDGIGGYYDLGRGYGPNYRATGCVITANDIAANDFTTNTISVSTFGGSVDITSITVDATMKTVDIVADWDAGYTFEVTLTQVQF